MVIICLSSLGLSLSREIKPLAESLNYCADIKSVQGNYTIVSSKILYGKWTAGAGTSDEIAPPTNKSISYGQILRVCSSGRAWVPSGTEASIVLTENSDYKKSPIEIYWDVPAIGPLQHTFTFNASVHTVVRRLSDAAKGSNLYEYYLFKL